MNRRATRRRVLAETGRCAEKGLLQSSPFSFSCGASRNSCGVKLQFMPHRGNSCPQSGQFILGRTDHRGVPEDD